MEANLFAQPYPDVSGAVKECLTFFAELPTRVHDHFCAISSHYAVTSTITLRDMVNAVEADLSGESPAAPRPFSFG